MVLSQKFLIKVNFMDSPYTPKFKFIDYWGKISQECKKVNKDVAEKHVQQILKSLKNNSKCEIVTAQSREYHKC